MDTSWSALITECMEKNKITEPLIHCTLTVGELYSQFDNGFGSTQGIPFTAWSENYVFFPVIYDGAEWVDYVPRNPCDFKKDHVGGG
jgi:hypothetical protein